MISKDLLEILCCPATKQPLQEANAAELENINSKLIANSKEKLEAALITENKKTAYPIRQNIPVLLSEEAIPLE